VSDSFHMDPADFHGHAMLEWVADYMDRVAEPPVTPDVKPG
jgi:hypothetical protein